MRHRHKDEAEKVDLRDVFPSRNTFSFDNGVTISSEFCGGNLMECHEIDEEKLSYRFMSQEDLRKAIASHRRTNADASDDYDTYSDNEVAQDDHADGSFQCSCGLDSPAASCPSQCAGVKANA